MEILSLNKKEDWDYPAREFGDSSITMDSWAIENFLQDYQRTKFKEDEGAINALTAYFDRPGCILISAGINDYVIEHEYDKNMSFDIDICSSLGLVQSRFLNIRSLVSGKKANGYASFCSLSALGIKLVETCSPDTINQLNNAMEPK